MNQSISARPNQHVLRKIATFLNVAAGEERLIGLLIAFYFILSLGFVFVQSMAFGLFLSEYGPQGLPYSYIFIAAAVSLLAAVYIKLSGQVAFSKLLVINITFLAVVSVLIWLALNTPIYRPTAFILPFWFQVVVNFGNLAVWPLAGSLFDFRQGKRLFPLLGAGNWLANIIGGFFVPALVNSIGAVHLLLLAGASFAAALILLRAIMRAYVQPPAARPAAQRPARAAGAAKPRSSLLKNRYIVLIFAYTILWWVAFFFVDNIFYDRVYAQFADANQVTAFLGRLLAIIGMVALVASTLLNSRIIARFGLRTGLIAMPLAVTLSLGVLALSGSLDASLFFMFALAAFVKLINVAFGFSLSQSANAIVYQSVAEPARQRVQTTAEGIVQPLAVGLAGIALLVLTSVFGFKFVGLAYVAVGLGIAWLLVILALSGGYIRALTQVITKRRLGDDANVLADPICVDLLTERLSDPHPAVSLYALNRLEALDPQAAVAELSRLLQHPAGEVRFEALKRVEKLRLASALPAVQKLAAQENAPEIRGIALRALGAIAGDGAPISEAPASQTLLLQALHEPHPPVLHGALVGLLKYQSHPAAEEKLGRLLTSSLDAERILGVEILGELHRPETYPQLIAAGGSPVTSRAAGQALSAIGAPALPAIAAAYGPAEGSAQLEPGALSPRLQTLTLTHALGQMGGTQAQALLLSRLDAAQGELRAEIIHALSLSGYHTKDLAAIQQAVQAEVQQAAWVSAVQVDLQETTGTALLQAALQHLLDEIRSRALLLLSFIFDADSIRRVREALQAGTASQASYALEIMDVQLPAEWKKMVMPLLENIAPQERNRRLAAFFPQSSHTPEARFTEIINNEPLPYWVRACAAYSANTGDPAMLSTVEKVLVLKGVSMFSQTPDNVLADVAGLLEEVDAAEGETVIRQGEAGDCMYVILDGKVRVHTGERLLNTLGEREVFGEMALLDPEPRLASVTAVEPTRLFRLDQAPFYDLMAERPEVGAGIIRVLTGRLRSRVQDIAQLNQRIHELENPERVIVTS